MHAAAAAAIARSKKTYEHMQFDGCILIAFRHTNEP